MTKKKCSGCKKIKLLSEFTKRKTSKDGYHCWCKLCTNKYAKNYIKQHPDRAKKWDRKYNLKHRCGLQQDEFLQISKKQKGKCLICKKKVVRLCIDHNHKTGKVRGLLCQNCNAALGMVDENINVLKDMIRYIKNG